MNKYPYNGGHLMIVPYTHKGDMARLTTLESNEMFELVRKSAGILKKAMPADGFNIGMNLGAAAGAGIAEHLHIHVVPRFIGDTNFMVAFGDTKVQSMSLVDIYDMLKPLFKGLKGKR
jgi:ATP adenylyltransferase